MNLLNLTREELINRFTRPLFWDSDLEKLDFDLNKDWIIRRVFSRGLMEDFRLIRKIILKGKLNLH